MDVLPDVMSDGTDDSGEVQVQVEGIGGIERAEVEIKRGLNVLTGTNASNRTSLIYALNAVLGGSRGLPNVLEGEGQVQLQLDGTEYCRSVREAGSGGVTYTGEPVSGEPEVVDTYVTLDSRNPIRRSVMTTTADGSALRELLMLPVDDDEIRREIKRVREEREEVEQELDRIDEMKERLPKLESRKQELEDDLEDVADELSKKRDEIEETQVDADAAEESRELFGELEEAEQEYDRLNDRLTDATETLRTAREERDELESRVDELEAEVGESDVDVDRLADRRDERNRLDGVVELLQQARRAVREISGSDRIPEELTETDSDVLAELSGGEVSCWACGSVVPEEAFDEQAEKLDAIVSDYRERLRDVEDQIDELREQERAEQRLQENLREARSRLRERERTVERYESRVERIEHEVEEQKERVENLQEKLEETEPLRDHPIVDLQDEVRELSREQGSLERELEDVVDEIEKIERRVDPEEDLREEHEELSTRIESLNARVERLEADVVERVQGHLDALIDLLDYEAVERVRVDLKRYAESDNEVCLSVVRQSEDGAVQDYYGLESLSESERSMVGLAVALAAYQTHSIDEKIPMVLLDSVEEFDGPRVSRLVEYMSQEAPRVLVSLLPADADAVDPDAEMAAPALG